MGDGQLSLAEQLNGLYRGMQSRMAPVDFETLRHAEAQLAVGQADQAILQPGDPAPGFALLDQNGASVRLADWLALGPVVLLFSRGGWCPFCTLWLRAWQDALPRLHDAGGHLLAIFPQQAAACGRTAERDLLAYPVLSDPCGMVADSYGVTVDLPEMVRPVFLRLGHDLPRINGSGTWRLPLPATFVIASNGSVAMAHADLVLPNRLDPKDAIRAVRRLVAAVRSGPDGGGSQ
jgi:peroxiredoxin